MNHLHMLVFRMEGKSIVRKYGLFCRLRTDPFCRKTSCLRCEKFIQYTKQRHNAQYLVANVLQFHR